MPSILRSLGSKWVWIPLLALLVLWLTTNSPRGAWAARRDHARGEYKVVWCGKPPPYEQEYRRLLEERYGVRVTHYGSCEPSWGDAYYEGYGSASEQLLAKKFGKDIVAECRAAAKENCESSSRRGSLRAKADHVAGRLLIKERGKPTGWQRTYEKLLFQRYGVRVERVGDSPLSPQERYEASGYFMTSRQLLLEKFGKDIFAECSSLAQRDENGKGE